MTNLTIANTIRDQIRAIDPTALTAYGAKDFVATNNSLQFQVKGLKHRGKVIIELTPLDFYKITFGHINHRKMEFVIDHEVDGVHCNMLVNVLDRYIEGLVWY